MKLTKTQQNLIDQAKKHGGMFSVDTTSGRGPQGGRVAYGARDRAAMFGLEKMGLITITGRQPWSDCNRGYTMGGTHFAFRLV